jgi:predicted metalloendopeptidase
MKKYLVVVLLACAGVSSAQTKTTTPKALTSLELGALDRNVDPCVDFYEFACGGWRKANPIPGDKARWGRFDELSERNLYVLKEILDGVSSPTAKRDPIAAQVGDYYAACMDEKAIEAKGLTPIKADLAKIDAAQDRAALLRVMGGLRQDALPLVFNFGVGADLKDSNQTLMQFDQGGISLPDRDNYLKTDPKSVEMREKYLEHLGKMFQLIGDSPEKAAANAKAVLSIETKLAEASMDRTARRDPKNRDNRMTTEALSKMAPDLDFKTYLDAAGAPSFAELNVISLPFFQKVNANWQSATLDDWKTYIRWRLLNAAAPALSAAFVNENFRFFQGYVRGIKEIEPRWKRCVQATDNSLGEALGKLYVDKTFGAEGKTRMQQLVAELSKAMEQDINQLEWMTPETKKKAIEKLNLLNKKKIGYPDKYRDYSTVKVTRDDYLGNFRRAGAFESKRNFNKLGKPVDKTEWGMTPPTVNAYYSPQFAEIVFPAGILQPPFFDRSIDDPVNFGAIGSVIGHELSHGFDDSGRKFDGNGNLQDWWTEADGKAFEERSACFDKQYSSYTPVNDPKTGEPRYLKGKLTMGENIGDNGGVRISYMALMNVLAGKPQRAIDGFTPEQRFFLGFGQVWCQNTTDPESLRRIDVDPHSAGKFRANGTVSNMPEFQKAFNCKAGQPMAPEQRCRIW